MRGAQLRKEANEGEPGEKRAHQPPEKTGTSFCLWCNCSELTQSRALLAHIGEESQLEKPCVVLGKERSSGG